MKRDSRNTDETLRRFLGRYGNPPDEQIDSEIDRAWSDLQANSGRIVDENTVARPSDRFWHLRRMALAGALVAAAIMAAVIVRTPATDPKPVATRGEQQLVFGDVIRSGAANEVLVLADGSRIEMRSGSELVLEKAANGVRIRLNAGNIIVTAAEQEKGHLYVQTKDLTVSVVGTVFLVNAEEKGSRVAVIEGEVRVRQGTIDRRLLPGEQISTNPSMGSLPMESHLALLQQSVVALPSAPPKSLEFEVATIKPSGPDSPALSITSSPGRIVTSNTSLKMLVTWAYDISSDRLVGAPDWLDSVRFDILAKVPARDSGEEPGRERLKLMMQSLLAQRFHLLFHRETRELSMYVLVVAKKGPQIQPRPAGSDAGRNTFNMPGSGRLVGTKVTTGMLAKVLAGQLNREVDDRTELQGIFDFTLEWAPESDAGNASGRPSIFTAVREQLGFELVARKGPVEILAIDQIERLPAPN